MDTSATLSPILTSSANQFMRQREGFVGRRLFPPFSSALQSANYYVFTPTERATMASLSKRAPGTKYQRVKRSVSTDLFACENYGLEAPVPDEDRAKYSNYFSPDQIAIQQLVDTLLINHEQRVYAKVTDASVPTAAIAIPWNNANSNPKVDVDAARESVRQNTGLMANTLVISQPVLNALSINPKIADFFKYTVAGVNDEQKIAAYFQIANVMIAREVVATNNEGQTFSPGDIWGSLACVAHVEPGESLELPNFGRTFYWNAFTSIVNQATGGTGPASAMGGGDLLSIASYRDETIKSDIHRSEHYTDEKITAAKAGFTLTGLIG